jgi:hypothetical protein
VFASMSRGLPLLAGALVVLVGLPALGRRPPAGAPTPG